MAAGNRFHRETRSNTAKKVRRIDLSGRKLLGPYGLDASESVGRRGIKMGKKPGMRLVAREA